MGVGFSGAPFYSQYRAFRIHFCSPCPSARAPQIRSPKFPNVEYRVNGTESGVDGNLRLSLVVIPVKLYPAVSPAEGVSFRMIHKPSGQPIRYVKGIPTSMVSRKCLTMRS